MRQARIRVHSFPFFGLNTAASDPLELRRVAVDNRDHLADFIWNMSELRWVSRDVRGKVASH